MSVVSGVTLLCGLMEFSDEQTDDAEAAPMLSRLNGWLEAQGRPAQFRELSESYGGGKHPQCFAFGAGINKLDEDAFSRFVLGMPWHTPENVVLVIQPEDGPTRVWRPSPS